MKESTKDTLFNIVMGLIGVMALIGFFNVCGYLYDWYLVSQEKPTCETRTVIVETLPRKEKCEKLGGEYRLDGYTNGW